MFFKFLEKFRDEGLLILRIGFGAMFIYHGYPKLTGGPATWEWLGNAMGHLGITFMPQAWGFLAASAEFFGGILVLLGLFFRPVAMILSFNMFVATFFHFANGEGMKGASHAMKALTVFISMIFIGPGKYSLDEYIMKRRKK